MVAYRVTIGGTMNPLKSTVSVLVQIACWIPDRIIDNLAKKNPDAGLQRQQPCDDYAVCASGRFIKFERHL